MKYYWIASTIEIKTAVLPCRKINTKNMSLLILSNFRPFFITYKWFYWFFKSFYLSFLQYFSGFKIRALTFTFCKKYFVNCRTGASPDVKRPQLSPQLDVGICDIKDLRCYGYGIRHPVVKVSRSFISMLTHQPWKK